jgi:predicted GNAT family acetyltransferase
MSPRMVRDNEALHRYEILVGDKVSGYLQYRRVGSELFLVHTEIFPGAEGHGYASELVRGVLDESRRGNMAVVVVCPFVQDWLAHHPEYGDLNIRFGPRDGPTGQ